MCTNNEECLAERLRRENYEQFNILVRMHLSFVLDLNTDENDALVDKTKLKKWSVLPFRKSKSRGVMDGAPLTQEGICQVYQLIEFLKKEPNICKEGVFRRTGSLNRQHDLRSLLNQGTTLCLEGGPYSVHDCASVLKGFLAELPEPLLTEAHYPAYCQIAETSVENEERLTGSLQLLFLLLPTENRVLLKDVLDLLHLTASYEGHNKMSADSLATLFTPHLLCPRKLSPENLHLNSQTLSVIVSYMIRNCKELFNIPPKLSVDIKAYLQDRDRKKILSPEKCVNESVTDNFASTVFSFVDHERTAKENQSNPTETALAQLYAHIQCLPESAQKKKLVKQFNKCNGNGTPVVLRSNLPKSRSLGDSIKKHIFQKRLIKSVKKSQLVRQHSSSEELLNSPRSTSQSSIIRSRLFCGNCDSSSENDETAAKKLRKSTENLVQSENEATSDEDAMKRSVSEPDLSSDDVMGVYNTYLTSTPACVPRAPTTMPNAELLVFTPDDQDRKSMSPITRSTQRMSRAMQETMMTPRSRKPVLLMSGTNINNLASEKQQGFSQMEHVSEAEVEDEDASLTSDFREYLHSRSLLTASPTDLSFSSRTDDYSSTNIKDLSSSKMSASLLCCMDGNVPGSSEDKENVYLDEKEPVLKPKQFDENGLPTVYETSF
ncbi:PREDICTED: rho GTPase-activating protein 19 [Nicrophorus vespilloides]|uniref:Rho GTPase-activating protein 19 n=1 Tax=Nicrophorus vespilloides TaxID=110193 RepID=A0ABM1MYE8_NICVS|nr:PREDICTED: rho GTPase-activating protein 19 [Nicrophorus vespilloides]